MRIFVSVNGFLIILHVSFSLLKDNINEKYEKLEILEITKINHRQYGFLLLCQFIKLLRLQCVSY